MEPHELLIQKIDKLTRCQSVFLTLSGAQRIFPVIKKFSSKETTQICTDILSRLWKTSEHVKKCKYSIVIRALPEAGISDSYDPRYFAMRALGIIFDACKSFESIDNMNANEFAVSACIGLINLASDFDQHLSEVGKTNAAELNSLEQYEISAQNKLVLILTGPVDTIQTGNIDKVRLLSTEQAQKYREILVYV